MKLIFIRHGDPDYANDTLTPKGRREAQLLVKRIAPLDVKQYYCSPLGRAKDTAEYTLKKAGRTAVIFDWLREFPGYILDPVTNEKRIPWDLMPSYWTEFPDLYDKDNWIKTDIMRSGNVPEIYDSVCSAFDSLLAENGYERVKNYYKVTNANSDTLVFFCHFGIESVLLSRLLGISPLVLWQSFVALPTSVTTVVTEEREEGTAYFRCNGFGDISHLYAGGEEPSFSARFCEKFSNKDERH